MTTDLDIYRSAHALIQRHGDAAAIEAAMKADAMLDKGDSYRLNQSRRRQTPTAN